MRLAVIADVHGNADALAATLDHIRHVGCDAIVNLGDCFSGPLDAARTADLLAGAGIAATVRGNHDRYLIEQDPATMGPSDRAAHEVLPASALDWLRTLPETLVWDDVFLCHATPQADDLYWCEEVAPDGTVRRAPPGRIAARAKGIAQPILLCAHSHLPRVLRLPGGQILVNPGSVGCPAYRDDHPVPHVVSTGTPQASHALIDTATGAVSLHLVPYDTGPAVARARAAQRPDWAEALETGWIT